MNDIIVQVNIESKIYEIRGEKVMIDSDLALMYEVTTSSLNRQVKRNLDLFPDDFMFRLTKQEVDLLRCQIGISNKRGGRAYMPYAFTQEGISMLSGVLKSKRARQVNVEIMRAFIRLRKMVYSHKALWKKFEVMEQKYDKKFRIVFDAIKKILEPEFKPKKIIGFRDPEKN